MFYIEFVPRINTGLFSSVKTAYVHVVTSKDVYLVTVFAMETARYCKLCMQGLRGTTRKIPKELHCKNTGSKLWSKGVTI